MFDNFTARAFDWLVSKGGIFCPVWAYGIYKIISAKDEIVFGLIFNDTEKGLALVFFTILCLLAHMAFGALSSVKKHHDPKSYSNDVYNAVNQARALIGELSDQNLPLSRVEECSRTFKFLIPRIPKEKNNRKILIAIMKALNNEVQERKSNPNYRDLARRVLLSKFIKETEWSLHDKTPN